jgi:Spy/CpxP family protein refolding chaperone
LSSILSAAVLNGGPQQDRRRTRENVITMRLLRMTRVLELTEEQTAKIFPVVTHVEQEKMEIYLKVGKEMKDLRLALKSKIPDEEKISNKIKAVKELRDRLESIDRELETILEESLTLIQRAKYLVFSADFNRDLRNKLDRARRMKERPQRKKK